MTKASLTRQLIHPKGEFGKYEIMPFGLQTKEFINSSSLSESAKEVLLGLLEWGNVMEFPGGVGLDYKAPFKTFYMPQYLKKARVEMAKEIQSLGANCLVAPDIAALFWAHDISTAANSLSIFRVQKDGKQKEKDYQGFINSYTKGTQDILYFDSETLGSALKHANNKLRLFLTDEIADTGKMLELLWQMVGNMKEDGLDAEIVGAGVIIEKTFTGARQLITEKLGFPLFSSLKISDMWLASGFSPAAIVVEGIKDKAFGFRQ